MKAAVLVELNKPLEVVEVELPGKLEYGQVLVKIHSSGICGSQIGEIAGVKGPDKFLPHLLGHEGGGEIVETGPGVTGIKTGDHVVLHWRKGFGIESPLPKYKWNGKVVNAGWVTTFNEYAVVSENRLTPIPEDIDFGIAALMGCAVTTGLGVINNNAKLKIGESVAIFGAGSIGLNVIQGAAMVSATPIIVIDIYDHKLELAKSLGATHLINSKNKDAKEEILKIVGSQGVDVAIDNTGVVEVTELAYDVTSSTGKTVLVGVPKLHKKASLYTLPLYFHKTISGSHGGESNPSVDIPRYIKLYKSDRLELKKMVTHHFELDEINVALDELRNGKISKCLIRTV